jgi:DNA-binding beta-propeller fold protein YncE
MVKWRLSAAKGKSLSGVGSVNQTKHIYVHSKKSSAVSVISSKDEMGFRIPAAH